jgi:acyl carrier protein
LEFPVVSQTTEHRERIRQILKEHGQLGCDTASLSPGSDLYAAGMSSRASVSVMLALESAFEIEFPDEMLRRDVFESIAAIEAAVLEIQGAA